MLRSSPASAMQKTYDDCYLICSTAVYFEKQNNEDEALRSWRSALDNIYYFNAYKMSPAYQPKSETELALQESLISMERQCKERVDLLEGLRASRHEIEQGLDDKSAPSLNEISAMKISEAPKGHLLTDSLAIPHRPSLPARPSSHAKTSPSTSVAPSGRAYSVPHKPKEASRLGQLATEKRSSRTPSPEKRGGMLKATLRPQAREAPGSAPTTKLQRTMRPKPPAAAKAATMAWPNGVPVSPMAATTPTTSRPALSETSLPASQYPAERPSRHNPGTNGRVQFREHPSRALAPRNPPPLPPKPDSHRASQQIKPGRSKDSAAPLTLPSSETTRNEAKSHGIVNRTVAPSPPATRISRQGANVQPPTTNVLEPLLDFPIYRKEYKPNGPVVDAKRAQAMAQELHGNGPRTGQAAPLDMFNATPPESPRGERPLDLTPDSSSENEVGSSKNFTSQKDAHDRGPPGRASSKVDSTQASWDDRVQLLMKNLPRGVDEQAAKAIFNEIVIKGDEVHWDDVAGLDVAKGALKEAVVYPFLRPDLFMGLREPARGMLLFGPPGTGKTMLARAVATESRSTFFAISASSLTSKFLGESEKLVRALFSIAKALTPSIIFVDEIDSLLSSRSGSGEHEATRRIKTEFLIQWSDLARAAAGREDKNEGDASRVLVLAATNLPWAIDEAARRRFVRRQYIPLPEPHVREQQLRRLMSAQKHILSDDEFLLLVQLTDGFSGSDITALAKDAAMGPLRALGEKLLHMSPEDIKPISLEDFEQSLVNIRPSVSKQGLKEFEDWAREFGERGG